MTSRNVLSDEGGASVLPHQDPDQGQDAEQGTTMTAHGASPDHVRAGETESSEDPREAAIAWFVRLGDPAVRPEERAAFDRWLAAAPENRAAYGRVEALWSSDLLCQAALAVASPASAPQARGHGLRGRLAEGWNWGRGLALAASVLLAVVTLVASGGQDTVDALWRQATADHATATGELRVVTLADGSRITLNTASAVDVTETARGTRVILVQGDAYFDVMPTGPDRSFTVVTSEAEVTVVGTAFTVSDQGAGTSVAVRHGVVAVNDGAEHVILAAGEGVLAPRIGTLQPVDAVDDAFAWVDGRLQFHHRPLAEVLDVLDRSFPGMIVLADPALGAVTITGSYRLDNPGAVIDALADVVAAKVIRVTKAFVVLKKRDS